MGRDPEIEKLLAEREIMRTQYRYAHAIDYNVEDEWLDCFTEDGTYTVEFEQLPEWTKKQREGLRGKEALRKFIKVRAEGSRRNVTGSAFPKHVALLPRIEVDGDRATAVTYFVGFDAEADVPVVRDIGRYWDTFVKCPDGRWRIKDRIFRGEAYRKQPQQPSESALKALGAA